MVAGQPQRAAPAGGRRDRRQRQHRGPVGGDPVGRGAAQHPPLPRVDQRQPVGELGVEVGRAGEACGRAGTRSPGSRWPARPAPWPPDRPARQISTLVPSVPRNAWPAAVSSADAAAPRPTAPSPSQTSTRGTAPSPASSCHQPANRSSAARDGISTRRQPAGVAAHHDQHRQLRRRAGLAEPDRQRDRREPQVALGDLPGHIGRPRRRVRRQIHRPQLAHPVLEHRHRPAPSRSARRSPSPASSATPAAAPGSAAPPHPRSTRAPAAHTAAAHRCAAPPSPCSSRHPITRAIALIGIPSARCSRRISAQSSTANTSLPPRLDSSQGLGRGQFSAAARGSVFTRRRHH